MLNGLAVFMWSANGLLVPGYGSRYLQPHTTPNSACQKAFVMGSMLVALRSGVRLTLSLIYVSQSY
jgi:hypothetical protein